MTKENNNNQKNNGPNNEPKTITALINQSIEKHGSANALSFFDKSPLTYRELGDKIEELAGLLKKHGIRKGDRVAILGKNSPNWGISYLGIASFGAVTVPILPDFPAEDVEHILNHSESKLLFATKKQTEKLTFENCKTIKSIIILDDFSIENTEFQTIPFSEFLSDTLDKVSLLIHDAGEKAGLISTEVSEDDLIAIIYTSGTTGFSKGVMLTHKNILSNLMAMREMIRFDETDRFLSILPQSHSIEATLGFLLPLANGSSIYYLGAPPTPALMGKACPVAKPTVIVSVPLIIEKIYKKKVKNLFENSLLIRNLIRASFIKKILYKKAVKSILDFFGGHIRVMAFGGAPLNSEVEDFMIMGGFPYVPGYGLTETAPLLTGEPIGEARKGSCGYPLFNVEIKIVDPDPETGVGEIYAKGPNVMKGYFKNKKLTEEVLSADGWFKTGDRGYLGEEDYLYIQGRSKSMFLGSNGENIFPEVIEEKLNSLLCVQESIVVENKGDIEALIHLEPEFLETELEGRSEADQEEIMTGILEGIRRDINKRIPAFARIKKCYSQREPFQKTATHKIKRYLYSYRDS
ncbi:MAG: AMP-binding protein [Candidatus Aminicenantes bacterium]|nr:AMP-binding protein [Candidatus Aminicenantes bacterium]